MRVRLTLWFVRVTVQHSVTWKFDAFLLENPIHFPPEENEELLLNTTSLVRWWSFILEEDAPVLDVVLHVEVVDEQRVPQFGIAHCLIQRETCFQPAKEEEVRGAELKQDLYRPQATFTPPSVVQATTFNESCFGLNYT